MVKKCCVRSCPSESYGGCHISFHKFPKSEEMRLKWLEIIKVTQKITKNSVVCGRHFESASFYNANSRQLLKADAIPTISSVNSHGKVEAMQSSECNLDSPDSPGSEVDELPSASPSTEYVSICDVKQFEGTPSGSPDSHKNDPDVQNLSCPSPECVPSSPRNPFLNVNINSIPSASSECAPVLRAMLFKNKLKDELILKMTKNYKWKLQNREKKIKSLQQKIKCLLEGNNKLKDKLRTVNREMEILKSKR